MSETNDIIAASATPESVSAMAVVRLSGTGAVKTVEKIMSLEPGRLRGMRRKVGNFADIDQIVALSWPEGKSYTGEEMVDIMCHGTPGTAEAVLHKLFSAGARQAEPGEFTRRAWLNGRITAMDVLSLSARWRNIRGEDTGELQDNLRKMLTEIEALIEFGEEHETADEEEVYRLMDEAEKTACRLRDAAERMEILPKTYIMGPVNSGKSMLFNLLCEEKAAVGSKIPGTTRDGAERTVTIRGKQVRLCDTAGTGGDELDGNALEIALAGMRNGDRIVWMDRKQEEPPEDLEKNYCTMKAASIRDEEQTPLKHGWWPVSAVTGEGLNRLLEFVTAAEANSPSRVFARAAEAVKNSKKACSASDIALASEFVSGALEEICVSMKSGEAVERALETFCVGK